MDRQLLARATENSDAPTPGYMYLDIAKNASTNPATCSEIAKYLTNRLASKNNHNVKYKCLKVISKTCGSPYLRGQFKRCLAQDPNAMSAIKDALQFRGPPDPVRGDEPYERVRIAAKEALDAVYSDTPQDNGGGAPFVTSTSASYGQSPHLQHASGGGAATFGGARRMEGIGNPMFSDPRLEPQSKGIANMTAKEVLSEAKETVIGMIKDPLARNVTIQVGGASHNGNVPRPGGSYAGPGGYSGPPGRNELMHQTGGQWTMASNRGPSAIPPPANFSNDSAYYKSRDSGSNAYAWAQHGGGGPGGVGGSWASAAPSVASQAREPYQHQATPSITVTGGVVSPAAAGGTAVSDGSYEKQLIMELCPAGGMKAEPPPDKLNQFARSVSSLNPDLICPVLLDCLEEGQPWIIRAKALWVIEACIKHGQKPGATSNGYSDFFHACSGEIAPLVYHNRVQIREPAKRVLSLMGVATPAPGQSTLNPAAPPAAAPPVAAPPAPVLNLLDFDMGPSPTPEQGSLAPGNDSLFGGLNVAGSASLAGSTAPPPPPTSGNLLGDWPSESTATEVVAPSPSRDSLFGEIMVKESPAVPVTADAPVPEVSSMFDNLSLKAEGASTPVDSGSAVSSGSAFGFINQSVSTDSASEKKTDTIPSAQSRDSFDPLKNMTPNTAQKMMQVSPEQMQAMMYQQMMMQQQMQMAQMMAMKHQQARLGNSGMYMPQMQGVMQNNAAAKTSFAFMDKPVKTADKKFDFVQAAMSMEKKK